MFLEHITCTLAIAILVSIYYPQIRGAYLWAFTFAGCLPDMDAIVDLVQTPLVYSAGATLPTMAEHTRVMHNIPSLFLFAMIGALILMNHKNMNYHLSAFVIGAGFGAHLLEDFLVYKPAEAILWPLSPAQVGAGVIPWADNIVVADSGVLIASLFLVAIAWSMKGYVRTLPRDFRCHATTTCLYLP